MKEERCINCKYFGEGAIGKAYCCLSGQYDTIIHNPKLEKCNYYKPKGVEP